MMLMKMMLMMMMIAIMIMTMMIMMMMLMWMMMITMFDRNSETGGLEVVLEDHQTPGFAAFLEVNELI